MIYLDWNATAPLLPEARAAMEPWLGLPANPYSPHRLGQRAAVAVEEARGAVAALTGWEAAGVVFTSGATEANATVLGRGRWLVSAVEHPSVRAWGAAELPVDATGRVDLDALDAALAAGGWAGVSVMLANNETGVRSPVAEVAERCARAGVPLHVDATQGVGRGPLPWAEGAPRPAWVTLSAHKLGGPVGVGALLVGRGAPVEPLLRGGPQERGRRAGTPPVAALAGFGAAAAWLGGPEHPARLAAVAARRDRLEAGLVALGGRVAGAGAARVPNTTCVALPGLPAAELVMALDLEGVAVSAGAACSSGSSRPSPVLAAMGFGAEAVRFSLGPATTNADVAGALAAVERVLARVGAAG